MNLFKNNPIAHFFWSKIRLSRILRAHRECAQILHPLLEDYFEGRLETYSVRPLKELSSEKIIWQYWGQGMENLPEIVQISFASVDAHKGNYTVIRLTDKTIHDYIEIPTFIRKRISEGGMTKTFFSDWLRLALLRCYGGVWLDATTLLTAPLPDRGGFFMYQRTDGVQDRKFWESTYAYYWNWDKKFKVRCLNSFIWGKQGNRTISVLYDLLTYWWQTHEALPDYFFFQIMFHELTVRYPELNCPIVSDCLPHLLQMKINHPWMKIIISEAFERTTLHKMTYFSEEKLEKLKSVLKIYG